MNELLLLLIYQVKMVSSHGRLQNHLIERSEEHRYLRTSGLVQRSKNKEKINQGHFK